MGKIRNWDDPYFHYKENDGFGARVSSDKANNLMGCGFMLAVVGLAGYVGFQYGGEIADGLVNWWSDRKEAPQVPGEKTIEDKIEIFDKVIEGEDACKLYRSHASLIDSAYRNKSSQRLPALDTYLRDMDTDGDGTLEYDAMKKWDESLNHRTTYKLLQSVVKSLSK